MGEFSVEKNTGESSVWPPDIDPGNNGRIAENSFHRISARILRKTSAR